MTTINLIMLFTAIAIVAKIYHHWPWTTTLTRIVDGDSVETVRNNVLIRIRLAGIDAPEWNQPYGRESHHALAQLVRGKRIRILPLARDNYGRLIAHLFVDGHCVSYKLSAGGHVWPETFGTMLAAVPRRLARKALWATRPQHPSQWRKKNPRLR